MRFAIKNYHKNKDCSLVAKSIRHFIPDAKIFLFNIYDYIDLDGLNYNVFNGTHNERAKYHEGPGFCSDANGLYYTQGFNKIFRQYQNHDEKIVVLDENHFFTNGETLKELVDNEFDLAYAFWESPNPHPLDMNAAVWAFRPKRLKELGIFPLPEKRQYIETLLRENLLQPCINAGLNIYKMKTRDYNSQGADYKGDGCMTNSWEEMEQKMKENGII